MKLSELKTDKTGITVKATGHGDPRRRIIEMGFISRKKAGMLLNALLKDLVKYEAMGYEISLRHSEADTIKTVSLEEARTQKPVENSY